MTSSASYSNRINPCEAVAGETTNILREKGGVTKTQKKRGLHRSPFVYEAIRLLKEHGYAPFRLLDNPDFTDAIIATKEKSAGLLIAIIYSQKQVPDAHTLRTLFPQKVDKACAMVKATPHRTMIWVNSPVSGWRFYRVEVGGISYDWDIAKELGR
ncbi:MAG: hypothetical protein ABSG28_05645 [Methanoregula sp.]|uniref:hypothetical protein n=1 Tax=Methanoregula sp. TaxID=2052170 RepID=UPI003C1EE4B0